MNQKCENIQFSKQLNFSILIPIIKVLLDYYKKYYIQIIID